MGHPGRRNDDLGARIEQRTACITCLKRTLGMAHAPPSKCHPPWSGICQRGCSCVGASRATSLLCSEVDHTGGHGREHQRSEEGLQAGPSCAIRRGRSQSAAAFWHASETQGWGVGVAALAGAGKDPLRRDYALKACGDYGTPRPPQLVLSRLPWRADVLPSSTICALGRGVSAQDFQPSAATCLRPTPHTIRFTQPDAG